MGAARNQPTAKCRLKPLNMLADGGLADTQPLGSQREAAGLLKHHEAGKMLKVQHLSHIVITVSLCIRIHDER
ncbi:hypothetical protein D3C87_1573840 [compost metagenome]